MFKVSWKKFGINPKWQGKFSGKVDLHFHSKYSDGNREIGFRTICQIANFYGMRAVALADHDTTLGLEDFMRACREYSLPVMPAVEISASGTDIPKLHTLAYGFDLNNKELQFALQEMQSRFVQRFKSMAGWANDNLRAYQLENQGRIPFPRLLEEGETAISSAELDEIVRTETTGNFARTRLVDILLEKGFFPAQVKGGDMVGALAFRFLKPATKLVPAPTLEMGRMFELVHAASGLVFMAHPFGKDRSPKEIALSHGEEPEEFIRQLLAKYPYDGIEAAHSEHSLEQTKFLKALVRKTGLLMSGSSDTHWKEKDPRIFGISPRRALTFQKWMEEKCCG